jgi:molybdopterin-synthase adenylyltransferase
MLSDEEKARYNKQLLIDGLTDTAQEKLKKSTVFIAGAGGLGSPVSYYLAAAGVGNIRICDNDKIELSNLNRQILHNTERIGMDKSDSARMSLSSLNPSISIKSYKEEIKVETIEELCGGAGIIIDCLDNIKTRYIINKFSLERDIPIIHGGINGMSGQISFIFPGKTPCLKCIFPIELENTEIPVLGAAAGVIGSIQAVEAIKYLTGIPVSVANILLLYDGFTQSFDRIEILKNPHCDACGGVQ